MLRLNLEKDTPPVVAMLLVVQIAHQVAENLGLSASIVSVSEALKLCFEEGNCRTWEVAVAHLRQQLGPGYSVTEGEDGLVTVALAAETAPNPLDAPEPTEAGYEGLLEPEALPEPQEPQEAPGETTEAVAG